MTKSTPLMTTNQVAERLGVSPQFVLGRWRDGSLPGYRLGGDGPLRFEESEMEAWAQARGEGGEGGGGWP